MAGKAGELRSSKKMDEKAAWARMYLSISSIYEYIHFTSSYSALVVFRTTEAREKFVFKV